MPRTTLFKAVLLLVLVLFLAVPSMQAEPRRDAEPVRSVSSGLAAWDWLAQVWEFLNSALSENGCRVDPNGRCLTDQSPPAEPDNGCGFEPDGCGS